MSAQQFWCVYNNASLLPPPPPPPPGQCPKKSLFTSLPSPSVCERVPVQWVLQSMGAQLFPAATDFQAVARVGAAKFSSRVSRCGANVTLHRVCGSHVTATDTAMPTATQHKRRTQTCQQRHNTNDGHSHVNSDATQTTDTAMSTATQHKRRTQPCQQRRNTNDGHSHVTEQRHNTNDGRSDGTAATRHKGRSTCTRPVRQQAQIEQ